MTELKHNPLAIAASNNNLELVEILIEKGADINQTNNYGSTCLHEAARKGKVDIVELLINHGADINIEDKDGYTPLLLALLESSFFVKERFLHPLIYQYLDSIQETRILCINLLIKKGAEVNIEIHDVTPFCYIGKYHDDLGSSALHHAVIMADIPLIELLIEKGADLNTLNNKGQTPLIKAVESNNTNIVNLLLEKGAKIKL